MTIRFIGDIIQAVQIFEVLDCGNGNSDALCFVTLNHNSIKSMRVGYSILYVSCSLVVSVISSAIARELYPENINLPFDILLLVFITALTVAVLVEGVVCRLEEKKR